LFKSMHGLAHEFLPQSGKESFERRSSVCSARRRSSEATYETASTFDWRRPFGCCTRPKKIFVCRIIHRKCTAHPQDFHIARA
jgi:hypothetical protein